MQEIECCDSEIDGVATMLTNHFDVILLFHRKSCLGNYYCFLLCVM